MIMGTLDGIDLKRMSLNMLAAATLSKDHYVLLRYSERESEWRVNVRLPGERGLTREHASASRNSPAVAIERALDWLREAI